MSDLTETDGRGAMVPVSMASDAQRAIEEVQASMVIAQKFPRSVEQARHRILNACSRPKLADASQYTYARGGSDITGPSIRLAEVLAQNWGNINFGLRELANRPSRGNSPGVSLVQAFCWDLETNTKREMSFNVPHVRHTRQGVTKLEDPRDVYEMIANQGARRMRACILAVIPGDIVDEAVDACNETMKAKFDITPENLKGWLTAWERYGVTKAMIEKFIQRDYEAIQPTQMIRLHSMYNSIKDGIATAGEYFDMEQAVSETNQTSRSDSVKSRVQKNQASRQQVDKETGEIAAKGAEQEDTGEPTSASLVADFNAAIETASTIDELNIIETDLGEATLIESKDRVIVLNGLIARKESIAKNA